MEKGTACHKFLGRVRPGRRSVWRSSMALLEGSWGTKEAGRHVLAVCGWQTRSSPSLPLVLTSYIMCLALSAFLLFYLVLATPAPG